MARQPQKLGAVGGTGSGKTTESMRFINDDYSNPSNPNARKTLIYDSNIEFKDVKALAPASIPDFNRQKLIEIRRILPKDMGTGKVLGMDDKYELLCDIIDNYGFKNGLLYLEDINNYVIHAHTKHLINLLTTNRHSMLDIFINVQTFGALPPRLWGNLNHLRIHRTNDDPFIKKVREQIPGKIEPLQIAYLIVKKKTETDPYFFTTLNFNNMKITGNFTVDDFLDASEKYLLLNKQKVNQEAVINKVSHDEAVKMLKFEHMRKYNGNVKLKEP